MSMPSSASTGMSSTSCPSWSTAVTVALASGGISMICASAEQRVLRLWDTHGTELQPVPCTACQDCTHRVCNSQCDGRQSCSHGAALQHIRARKLGGYTCLGQRSSCKCGSPVPVPHKQRYAFAPLSACQRRQRNVLTAVFVVAKHLACHGSPIPDSPVHPAIAPLAQQGPQLDIVKRLPGHLQQRAPAGASGAQQL